MKKKIYLTKNRLKQLDLELSMDDILYEKFRRIQERFAQECKEWNRRKQVVRIIKKDKDVSYVLQIIDEIRTSEGIFLEVK